MIQFYQSESSWRNILNGMFGEVQLERSVHLVSVVDVWVSQERCSSSPFQALVSTELETISLETLKEKLAEASSTSMSHLPPGT